MIEKIKKLLGFVDSETPDDEEIRRNQLLEVIIEMVTTRLKVLLGGVEEIPEEMEPIAIDVSVKRYNRIGSEAASSHSVEGETWSFNDNDFDEFADEIRAWRESQKTVGYIKFF